VVVEPECAVPPDAIRAAYAAAAAHP